MSIIDKVKSKLRREPVDQTPVAIPVQFRKSESMDERMRRIIDHSYMMEMRNQGFESFEDADDFDIPDDPVDPASPWEDDFDAAAAAAVQHGVARAPDITPQRAAEVREKVKNARRRKSKDQVDLEDAIAEGFRKGREVPPDDSK